MKRLVLCALALCLITLSPAAQTSHRRPLPDIPPEAAPKPKGTPADPARLKREAEELARLAQSIPADVESVNKGLMPKDLDSKLKEIEKLSKQLRRELSP